MRKHPRVIRRRRNRRLAAQWGFFVLVNAGWLFSLKQVCVPVFNCYSCPIAAFSCPLGVLAHFSAWHAVPFVTLGLLGLFGAALGRLVCGWACPFGLFQDLLARLPTPKFRLPHPLRWLKYAVLVGLILIVPYFFGVKSPLFFCRLCPVGTLESGLPGLFQGGTIPAAPLAIFVVLTGLMLFTVRPFCVSLCPLGALLSLCNRFSLYRMDVREEMCHHCNICERVCPVGIRIYDNANAAECIRCLDCKHCQALTGRTQADEAESLEAAVASGQK
jgi:polyferredoxin